MGHIPHNAESGQCNFPLPWLWPQRLSIESHISMWVEVRKPGITDLGSIKTYRQSEYIT
jgi:hypothetical protein